MGYEAHSGPGHVGYSHGGNGPNDAYFDKDDAGDSPFEHYKDNQYNKNEDNPLGGDYNKAEQEDQKKEDESKHTLIDDIKKEEEKLKKDDDSWHAPSKSAEETPGPIGPANIIDNKPKKNVDHKSIEEAIKDASKSKKGVFVLE